MFAGDSGATTGETDRAATPSPNPSASPHRRGHSRTTRRPSQALDAATAAFEAPRRRSTAGDLGKYQSEINKAQAATEAAAKAMGR